MFRLAAQFGRLSSAAVALIAVSLGGSGCRSRAPVPQLRPLAIYYGWPSRVSGAQNVSQAIERFAAYRVVVLGAGLERPSHADHRGTAAIIAGLRGRTEVYGYVPLGAKTGLTQPQIKQRVAAWQRMGVAGIFFDEAGYDFGNTRPRQNRAFEAAHRRRLRVFANAHRPADLFLQRTDAVLNPRGEAVSLRRGDAYLYESFVVELGREEDAQHRRRKLRQLAAAKTRGIRIFAVTTVARRGQFDGSKWRRAIRLAANAGFTGIGWGEFQYSAVDGKLTFRPLGRTATASR